MRYGGGVNMPLIQAGNIKLNYVEHGSSDNIVVYIHGNLACAHWMDLIWKRIPQNIHVFAIDWRGCGDSDKPAPRANYENYSLGQHAADMVNAIKALGIKKCGLATHSTGGIISTYMLLAEPDMFTRVLALDPASPRGLKLLDDYVPLFQAMKESRDYSFNVLAGVAPALFIKETLKPGKEAQFKPEISQEQKDAFNLLIDKTRVLSDGVWFGTPFHLAKEREEGTLAQYVYKIRQPHLVLWGEDDNIIPRKDMEEMTKLLPNCQLKTIKGIGHSLNIEDPDLYAQIFTEFFSQ
jgi:non-heme chloroperoxidase